MDKECLQCELRNFESWLPDPVSFATCSLFTSGKDACDRPLVLPPAFAYIALKFPRIRASLDCDRTLPRCKECDQAAAEKRAADAILPPPYYINPVAQIKKQIDLSQELIKAGVRREELEMELPALMKEGLLRLQNRNANMRSAWHEYWEIWGWQQGQPRP